MKNVVFIGCSGINIRYSSIRFKRPWFEEMFGNSLPWWRECFIDDYGKFLIFDLQDRSCAPCIL
ncbi:MAG: hypothetical protein L6N94_03525 [Candidatus Methylarchaceae archaeon HK01M]|nr:hypothetical protein [Candidatus Methylarchaceae archaeon HK01M]